MINEILNLTNQMSPYILLGFLLAGIMHAFVPKGIYRKYLGGNSLAAVFYGALLGVPLPLCSCGVIPTAMSLRKEGASKGATVSFLIATPQTGVDSIIATYSLMGLPFALLRPLVALITALCGGLMVNVWDDKGNGGSDVRSAGDSSCRCSSHAFVQKLKDAFSYAFVGMIQDIGKWLMFGLLIAGLITIFVPDSFFALFSDNTLFSMLLVLAFAIPMYLCATGSIPIAVALMMKGLSPGAALVLLMAGPAVNMASVLVINKVLGRRTLVLYLSSIIVGSMLFGLGVDYLLPNEWFIIPLQEMGIGGSEGTSVFHVGCSILLAMLLLNAFVLKKRLGKDDGCCAECVCDEAENHEMTVLYIKGMTCVHCKNHAEQAIRGVEGVEDVHIDLADGKTIVRGSFKVNEVISSVEAIGFSVDN